MTRFRDKVAFEFEGDLVDGVWSANIVERVYKGEVLEALRSLEPAAKVEDDIRLQNRIRIIGDAFALENFLFIRYVLWNGVRWTVNSVEIQRPDLTLSLGGVYHGEVAKT